MAEGFALASVLLFGTKMILGIFLGQILLAWGCMPPFAGLSIAVINALEALIAYQIFNYFKLDKRLLNPKDIIGLVALILFVLQPFSSFLGTFILTHYGIVDASEFQNSLFSWWFGNTMGQILVTPTLLLLYAYRAETHYILLILYAIVFALLAYTFQILIPIVNVSLLLSITLPPIIYISFRSGIQYATFSVLVITSLTLYLTHLNLGVFNTENIINNLINLNFYFLSQMLLVLIIGTLFAKIKRGEQFLKTRIAEEIEKNKQHTLIMLQQSRLAQMGEVLNLVAHQWRQPLNNLLLINEDFISQQYKNHTVNPEELHKFEQDSTLQIRQMSGTIDDFRDFFHPRDNKEEFLLNDVIEHLMFIMEPVFKHSNITLTINETEDVYMYGHPNEMAQALLNIVTNAKDALVENRVENKSITITLIENEEKITLTICDNARGIPSEIIGDIFNPYFSTKKSKKGTGLGLYMSKIIIEKHMKGVLTVENKNLGACFTICFSKENEL